VKIKNLIILGIFVLLISAVNIFAQGDFKMRQRMAVAGQNMESAVMIKGARERTESDMMGMKNVTIMECDLKRTIHINDTEKKYYIEPMVSETVMQVQPSTSTTTTKVKTKKGGTVTRTLEIIDTGERQQMFGLTARHIKTIMTTDPSPDACEQGKQRIETDGWYVDLSVGLSCKFDRPPANPMNYGGSPSCTEQTKFIQKGTAKLGYALKMTTKMSMGDDDDADSSAMMNMTTEVLELSKAALPQSLFEIPAGYMEVSSQSALYGKSTQMAMGGYVQKNGVGNTGMGTGMPSKASSAKKPGVTRVGVMAVTNSSGKPLSTDTYQSMLISQISSGNIEAVAVSSEDDAKRQNCDYILKSDIKALKQSAASKVGGLFGKVTGAPTQGKVEATIGYDLKPFGTDGTTLQMQATTAKLDSDENSIMAALGSEAQAVMKSIKK
jgi:hypothetical protein